MRRLVECVPNISEGRDRSVIDQIVRAASISGVAVLDVDPGQATNRTVITLAGEPEAILESAYRLIERSSQLIDMRSHKGEHPRIGATDVCPFVPLEGLTMAECVELARRLGERVGRELGIPVYLYEAAASSEARRSLAYIRQGEYEGLPEKLRDPAMQPDFGPAVFNARSGASVIGARPFLVAYNFNLNTRDKGIANQIAMRLRESGYKKKDEQGRVLKDASGKPLVVPGMFTHCRAVGWYIEEYGIAQISINFTDFTKTPVHTVFDAASALAQEFGVRITGSELVGLIPKAALLAAGEHYLHRQGATAAVAERELIHIAVKSLGLAELGPFNPAERIVEEKLMVQKKLMGLKLTDFVDLLSSDAPAPGGGSVSALAGSLSAALIAMVSALSFAKKKDVSTKGKERFEELGRQAQGLKDRLASAVDEDTAAFEMVMTAFRIKAASAEEKRAKETAVIEALEHATQIPLEAVNSCLECLRLAAEVVETGLDSALSDGAVAAEMAYAGMLGASYNVRINLRDISERASKAGIAESKFKTEAGRFLDAALEQAEAIVAKLRPMIRLKLA